MSMTVGSRLGPYEIVGPIGTGGMGEVYKALDTRLGRAVALKILPAAVALEPERLRRFEQEARATAALNDPNIVAVFDVGADRGISFVVSELLEGETLRDRLKTGPVPPRKAIEWATQVARGLAAAHDKGIIHRDLKPENLFVTRDGRIKILDFGIAKLADLAPASVQTVSPTVDVGTTPGVVLGTVGYMSPEQVRGLPVDVRTDIFSFGAILYEMLSGRRAFEGATHADTMSAILSADPPELDGSGRQVPPILDRIVRRCLEKSPEERYRSARDLAFSLDAVATTSSHGTGGIAPIESPPSRRRSHVSLAAGALALGLAIGVGTTWAIGARERASVPARFRQVTFRRGTISSARFSPDGETIVYSGAWEGAPAKLYSARTDTIGERPLDLDGRVLSISSGGELAVVVNERSIANWMQAGTLARVPLAGGAPREILHDVGGADWSPDGRQLAITRFVPASFHWRLEYPIGTVILETNRWLETPRFSRDGTRIALLEHPITGDNRGVVVQVTVKGERRVLTPEYPSVAGVTWSPSGNEVWFTASVTGNRVEMFAVSPGGAVRPIAPAPASIVIEDTRPDGRVLLQTQSIKARMLVKTPADTDERDLSWFDYPLLRDLSADGSMVLFDEEGEGGGPAYSVFVRKTDGSPAVRVADGYANALSPDRQSVLVDSPTGPPNTLTIVPIGAGEPRLITVPVTIGGLPRFFPSDAKRIVFTGVEAGHRPRAYEYALPSGRLRPLTPEGVRGLLVSRDARWIVGISEDGVRRLFPIAGGDPRDIAGLEPGDVVAGWSGDSSELFVSRRPAGQGRAREIVRLDIASGRSQVIGAYGPSDLAGVRGVTTPFVSADGRTYAYRYNQILSDLFVGTGLR